MGRWPVGPGGQVARWARDADIEMHQIVLLKRNTDKILCTTFFLSPRKGDVLSTFMSLFKYQILQTVS